MSFISKYRPWFWLLLMVPIYFVVFVKLGAFHVRLWDESYFAVQAYEMLQHGSWIVSYYEGVPENMGSKPPVQLWIQMLFIQMLGLNELALRLPSAIAAAAAILLTFHFVKRQHSERAAWVAALSLLTMGGFIGHHTGRSMEADSLLAFVMFLQVVFFWRYLQTKTPIFLVLFGVFVGVAFWVKSVAGFLFLPGFAVYLLIYERSHLVEMLRVKSTYLAVLLAVALPIAYLALREVLQPGHWQFLMERHVGRYGNDLGVFQSKIYYLKVLAADHFNQWAPFALAAMLWALVSKKTEFALAKYISVIAITFVLFISMASTKYEHYLNPLHPLLAVLVGSLGHQLLKSTSIQKAVLVLAAIYCLPLFGMFQKTQENSLSAYGVEIEASERFLFNAIKRHKSQDGLYIVHDGHRGGLRFYEHRLALLNQHISIRVDMDFKPGDHVLASQSLLQKKLEKNYDIDTLDQLDNAIVYHIKAKRNE